MFTLTTLLFLSMGANLPQPTDNKEKPIINKEMILEPRQRIPIPVEIKLKR